MPRTLERGKTPVLGLVEVGRISKTAARVVTANIQAVLEFDVVPSGRVAVPADAFVERRGQYDAGLILRTLASFPWEGCRSVLALTDVDLCSPLLTHVYGEAELGGRFAVVSGLRLREREDGRPIPLDLYYERLVKVALHEVAHTLSFYHCEASGCLMRFSPGLRHLDEVDLRFCPRCEFMLRMLLGGSH